MIKGGYYMKARKIQDSKIAHASPCIREIWDWLLKECNHTETKVCKRGECLTSYKEIIEGLSWYIGWRKMTYKKHDCENTMKWLKKATMITTRKTTRGMFISVVNYDKYQDPKNYENLTEKTAKTTRKPQTSHTIHKNDKNVKNDKNTNPPTPLQSRRAGLKSMEKQLAQNAADQEIHDNDTQSAMACFLDKTGKSLPTSKDMQAAQASVKCHGLQWVKDAIAKIDSVYFGVIVNEAEKQDRNNNGKSNRTYELPGNENDTILKTL